MTIFSKKTHEGYLMVDHRSSPGLPEDVALKAGLDPNATKEGKVYETATLGCPHCGSVVVMNPFRTRERAHCHQCDKYICDWCDMARHDPDYVHRTMDQIVELVTSGAFEIAGGSASKPILKPKGTT